MFFLLTVVLIYLFKGSIKPEKIIYEYEKRIAEYLSLPENQSRVSFDNLEKRTLNNEITTYYVLGESDEYNVILKEENGAVILYNVKNKHVEPLNGIPRGQVILIGNNVAIMTENITYFDPYTGKYNTSFFIKEKSKEKVVVSQICIANTLWDNIDEKLYPAVITEDFYNDIIYQLE